MFFFPFRFCKIAHEKSYLFVSLLLCLRDMADLRLTRSRGSREASTLHIACRSQMGPRAPNTLFPSPLHPPHPYGTLPIRGRNDANGSFCRSDGADCVRLRLPGTHLGPTRASTRFLVRPFASLVCAALFCTIRWAHIV